MNPPSATRLPRRRFLSATAAAGAVTVLRPATVFGAEANARVSLGLIGCGGRGTWIADLFVKTGKYHLTACADYFPDRVQAVGEKHGIEPARRYSGLAGYRRLLESRVDAVVIETPPYFHPEQCAAAVEAGKHVFVAKPIAVDVPGCLSIEASGKRATLKKLVFLVDFQTRANPLFREALARIRQGDLGKLVMVEAHYPWSGGGREAPPASREEQLRRWYHVKALSGDFIVEQAIHALDVATWVIDADPVRALGLGGQRLRPPGSIWDHFAVTFDFANGVPLSFSCIQTIPEMRDEITCRAYGSEGYFFGDYFGQVWIRGNEPFPGGHVGNLYTDGAVANILEFHRAITEGRYENPTVAPSVRSNLTAVLGREAAYRSGELTMAELLKAGHRLEFDTTGLRA
jgi:predicted dehydrogenase